MRRRLGPILALILASLAPAVARAQAQAPRSSAPRRGPLHTLYASDFGDSPSNPDNRAALQAALDRASEIAKATIAANAPITPRVTVFLQAGTHVVSGPINVPSYVELKGEGGSTKIVMGQNRAYTPVVIGMALAGLDPRHRPDLFGLLDPSAVPDRGARRGFRTGPTGSLISPASALSHGGVSPVEGWTKADRWFETRRLTIELAVMPAARPGKFPGSCSVFSLGSDTTGPAMPVALRTDGDNQWTFAISTQSARFAEPQTVFFTFSSGEATGLQRLSFQIDLDKGTFVPFTNGVQAAVTPLITKYTALTPGASLNENLTEAFYVNSPNGQRKDFVLAGLCLTRTKRYAENGPGTPQARADRARIADGPRFFPSQADDPDAICHLGLQEPDATTRHLSVTGGHLAVGGFASSAFVLGAGAPDAKSSFSRITDIAVHGNQGYGYAVMMGSNLETHFDGVIADAGLHGIGNIPNAGANYRVYVRDCTLSGSDSGFFGWYSIVEMDRVTFSYNGRASLRLFGCNLNARSLFVPRPSHPQYAFAMLHAGENGGLYSFRDVTADNEGDIYTLACVYCERHPNGTTLALENMNFGTSGPVPTILLRGMNTNWPGQAVLDATKVYASGPGPLVKTDDDRWAGSIVKSPASVLPAVVSTGVPTPITAEIAPHTTRNVKPAPIPAPAPAPPSTNAAPK